MEATKQIVGSALAWLRKTPFTGELSQDRDKIRAVFVAQPSSAHRRDRFRTLYQLLAAVNRAAALQDLYNAAVTGLLEATDADRAAILLFDGDGVMRFQASRGLSPEYLAGATGHSPWPRGDRDAQPLAVSDVLLDDGLAAFRGLFEQEGIRALAFIPISLETGVFGKLMLYYADPHECTEDELEIASLIAAHVALATERKRAELARAASEQRLQEVLETSAAEGRHLAAIVESSDDAIVSKNLSGIVTSWNAAAERIFGYTAEEAVGRPIAMLKVPGRDDEMPGILTQIRQGHRIDHYETRRRRKDGQIIDVSLTVSPVRNASGQIVGASKVARDITGRKRAEKERSMLLAREQEARRTAELLNRVGPRLAAQLDVHKLVQEVTDIATALVGAEFGALFHTVINENGESLMVSKLSGVQQEAFSNFPMPRNTELFGPTFRGEAVVRCEDITQDPRYGKDSPHLPVCSFLAVPVMARSGEVLGGLFFGHSAPGKFTETHEAIITGIAAQAAIAMDNARLFEETQWVQTELKRSNEELRLANRDLEVFAYSASHDLQEPLRTIAISTEILKRNWGNRLQGDDAMFLGNILTASQRMSGLTEDLLSYTRAAKYEEGPTPTIASAPVLAGVLETLRGQIEETAAIVTAAELPMVAIHKSRLAQLFQNLISNAIKYRSQEVARVHVAAGEQDGWCVFSVTDNGIGIEPQYAEQIFGLFKRLHGRDEYPGSGIGLAICQRVVEQYGGRIWLERSAPGAGSTFCFSLPSRSQ